MNVKFSVTALHSSMYLNAQQNFTLNAEWISSLIIACKSFKSAFTLLFYKQEREKVKNVAEGNKSCTLLSGLKNWSDSKLE